MPAKLVRRSAIRPQNLVSPFRRRHTPRRRIDDLGAAIGTVAAHEHAWVILRPRELSPRSLADRDDHHVTGNELVALRRANLDARGRAVAVAHDALRCGLEAKSTAVALRQLVLIVITRHVGLAAPVDDGRGRGAGPPGLGNPLDPRVACADGDDPLPHSLRSIRLLLL